MPRSLTDNLRAAKNATSAEPRWILRLDFASPVGAKYYSTVALGTGDGSTAMNAAARVLSFGSIEAPTREDGASVTGDVQIELRDDDGVIAGYAEQVALQGTKATIYAWFAGLVDADKVRILVGVVDDPVRWDWTRARLSFDLTDAGAYHRRTIGHTADRETFPSVAPADEGRVIPLVFGRAKRVPLCYAQSGIETRLVRPCGFDSTTLFVEDAQEMPQDTPLEIWVENELLYGSFHGNVFNVTQRGAVILTSAATADPAANRPWFVYDTTLALSAGTLVGHKLRVQLPSGAIEQARIIVYTDAVHRLWLERYLLYEGRPYPVTTGIPYQIVSAADAHGAGAPVRLNQGTGYVYIVSDAPAAAVHAVYARARIQAQESVQLMAVARTQAHYEIDTEVIIDPALYVLNRNDTTTFPDLSRAVTTIAFDRPIGCLLENVTSDALTADVDGVEDVGDGSGDVIENPAAIIEVLLTRWLGLASPTDYDAASFTAAAALLSYLPMAFWLDREWDSPDLLARIAFQARSTLLWGDGAARLKLLKNIAESSSAALDADQMDVATLDVLQSARNEIVSKVIGSYRQGDRQARVAVTDPVVAAIEDRDWSVELWAYESRAAAVSVANFWLQRRKSTYEIVKLKCFLRGLELQRLDTVTLDLPDFFSAGQRMLVTDVGTDAGAATEARIPSIALQGRLMSESECTLAESGEVESCWTCESTCQTACEAACMVGCEPTCESGDAGGGAWPPCPACEHACQAACEAQCQSGCETACMVGCESGESACGLCETGESGCGICESGESSCGVGCEVTCESGCEVACESGCETSCESGCEVTCESGCEVACESGCEVVCEAGETGCGGCDVGETCGLCDTGETSGSESGPSATCCVDFWCFPEYMGESLDYPCNKPPPEGMTCDDREIECGLVLQGTGGPCRPDDFHYLLTSNGCTVT